MLVGSINWEGSSYPSHDQAVGLWGSCLLLPGAGLWHTVMLGHLQSHHIPEDAPPLCLCSLLPFRYLLCFLFLFICLVLTVPFAILNFCRLFQLFTLLLPSYSMEAPLWFSVWYLMLVIDPCFSCSTPLQQPISHPFPSSLWQILIFFISFCFHIEVCIFFRSESEICF